jgi:RimJ/RimL family protein N-acetyltransferase
MVAECDPRQRVFWAVEVDGRASGGINIRFVVEKHVAEIGYAIARRVWGQGLATAAARLVVAAAFRSSPRAAPRARERRTRATSLPSA